MEENVAADGVVYHAGFPNAGETAGQIGLDVQQLVVPRPASTFFWKLGSDMQQPGWRSGDILVVDRALTPRHRDIVVAIVDEAFVVRRFTTSAGQPRLQSLDGAPDVVQDVHLWGVVTFVVQRARGL